MDRGILPGDPFAYRVRRDMELRSSLRVLRDQLNHELMDDHQRLELRERVLRLEARLSKLEEE